ncbi:hypothetical protein CUZ56_01203 [Saezia sanguinis]|uniref:Phage/plasmid-like protein n=1 Tax=Saezia sanguinis TaxID=1965230 RepID=A0A433SEV5_9BURK|nr:DUF932 domain-containing protein [Saezia sanguinis]RUS67260.1 hypothetical protein CUZ56_01203 [Saezia sanguinis]
MTHCIEQMAYVRRSKQDEPWHGLGNALSPQQPISVWKREAGMDWHIRQAPVCFMTHDHLMGKKQAADHLGILKSYPDQKVLYRSDTQEPLSVVSKRYQVVQPGEILEFYKDLTQYAGYELETAGVLKGGRKFWALARTGQSISIKGKDSVNGYLLLATSCDGTLSTVATPTAVRVVCNNTLAIALQETLQDGQNGLKSTAIRVPHNTRFDGELVKKRLGIAVSHWDEFMYGMRQLAGRKIKDTQAQAYFRQVLCDNNTPQSHPVSNKVGRAYVNEERMLGTVNALYQGHGRGAEMTAARGTAWGLLCAVTEYVDHERRARNTDNRLDSAWFGQGALIKQKALDQALQLVA